MNCSQCGGSGIFEEAFRCLCEQVANMETAMNVREIRVGDLVQTFHPTYCGEYPPRRPSSLYEIVEIHEPCTCPPYLVTINHMGDEDEIPPWPEHRHLVGRNPYSGSKGYLCASLDGTDVHAFMPGENYLLIVGERVRDAKNPKEGFQMGLFAC